MKARTGDLWDVDDDPTKDDPVVQFKMRPSQDSLSQEHYEHLRDAVHRAAEEIGLCLKDGFTEGGGERPPHHDVRPSLLDRLLMKIIDACCLLLARRQES